MKNEHWVQILVGIIILGTLAFLGTSMYDMRGLLSGVAMKVDQNEQRVSRIADVLPDVRARVAWDELHGPLSGFIAVSVPEERNPNEWVSTIRLYDARTRRLQLFEMTRPEREKDFPRYLVAGRIRAEGSLEPSFHELTVFANSERIPVALPKTLDNHASFVIRSQSMEVYEDFFREFSDDEPSTTDSTDLRNWLELSAELEALDQEG
ncbi:hypothetical protein EKK97_04460 [Billgrantia tianxiuensis]|uniref:Uncharacterized protein n=1 Tax=Billgrantia tianxiuensis TaxID=2497861 RepID=A0A6I6SHY8_9GAMM|nr:MULTISPECIES: hypothetical protein [Halomonas]MCE8033273.1 hypothetical protein [Halomonas sp. MCCC 1A11057]QHC49011.1 hypothetical protein EKK97_04460 [Halomonas tianxiuensis]